jgi:hypothetical protein
MFLTCHSLLLGGWTRAEPTTSAVVVDVHRGVIVDHGRVVDVMNVGCSKTDRPANVRLGSLCKKAHLQPGPQQFLVVGKA